MIRCNHFMVSFFFIRCICIICFADYFKIVIFTVCNEMPCQRFEYMCVKQAYVLYKKYICVQRLFLKSY